MPNHFGKTQGRASSTPPSPLVPLALCLLLLPAAPLAQAHDPTPAGLTSSPTAFSGTRDAATGQIALSWQPPADDPGAAYDYGVYRNGHLLATTTALGYVDPAPALDAAGQAAAVYQVTATPRTTGRESAPTAPLAFVEAGTSAGPLCGIYSISTNTSNPPFVFYAIHWDCIWGIACFVGACPNALPVNPPRLLTLPAEYALPW